MESAAKLEWLEANGLGGFASGTVAGLHTRRYHGLLMAAVRPPAGRALLLSKFEETLIVDGQSYQLSANRYTGALHPQGYVYLKQFRLDPFPVFVYELGSVRLEKTVFMVDGENTTVVGYRLDGPFRSCTLELNPLIAFRDYHSTTHENSALDRAIAIEAGSVRLTPYPGLPSLYLAHAGRVAESGVWYRNFEYDRERERGLDYIEDLFNPCTLILDLGGNPEQAIIASTEAHDVASAARLRLLEIERRHAILTAAPSHPPFVRNLARAAGQFIVKRGEYASVIAGYHWFGDWARDTMIALPGLTLATGRPELARGILSVSAALVNRGILPNRFPEPGETPEYNTGDASLWFFEAVRAYLAHTGDLEFIQSNLYPVLEDIVAWHKRGTRFGIQMDHDALLQAGEPGLQLTWMDAKIGDWVVTPRQGKPVEVQALWYNALRIMEDLAQRLSQPVESAHYRDLAETARSSFAGRFWNSAEGCLYDVVNGDTRDASIRPNQILAVSLFHTMLSPAVAAQVVATVERHLLTPFGLRTLSPSDPQYRGRYEGDPRSRDSAYHQGTVWPWLMGPFLTAYVKVNGSSPEAREQAARWLAPLSGYIENEGVGQLPELFDGDLPQRAGGCIAQAWTIAEILRTWSEDIWPSVC